MSKQRISLDEQELYVIITGLSRLAANGELDYNGIQLYGRMKNNYEMSQLKAQLVAKRAQMLPQISTAQNVQHPQFIDANPLLLEAFKLKGMDAFQTSQQAFQFSDWAQRTQSLSAEEVASIRNAAMVRMMKETGVPVSSNLDIQAGEL